MDVDSFSLACAAKDTSQPSEIGEGDSGHHLDDEEPHHEQKP